MGKIIILEAMQKKHKSKMEGSHDEYDMEDENKGYDNEMDLQAMAKDIMIAIREEEPDTLAESLKAFVKYCVDKQMEDHHHSDYK